jgi:hypothetical protein
MVAYTMNKGTLVAGLVIGLGLMFVVRFPSDAADVAANMGDLLGEVWDALRDVLRELL